MLIETIQSEVKILDQVQVSIYNVKLREDGILHAHVSAGGKYNTEDYRVLFPAVGKMVNYQKLPLMVTYDKFVFPPAEAAAFWANPETSCPYLSAEGLVLDSLPLRVLGNFYINFRKPFRPTKLFDNQQNALTWLRSLT